MYKTLSEIKIYLKCRFFMKLQRREKSSGLKFSMTYLMNFTLSLGIYSFIRTARFYARLYVRRYIIFSIVFLDKQAF